MTGPENPERYQELAAAVDRHCPVLDLFAQPRAGHPHAGRLTTTVAAAC